jgi:hypothetical protein
MDVVAPRYSKELERIRTTVHKGHDYFKHNYDTYNKFRRFVFETSLRDDEIALLASIGRPQLEFNILEAYISRLLGEFYKQEPDIEVSAFDPMQVDPMMIRLVEEHMRHFFGDDNNRHTRYEAYKQLLSGGFAVLKVFTDYVHNMSFDQDIKIELCEPTLCVFDPIAKLSHKGDGRWCCELYPYDEQRFKDEFPGIKTKELNFRRDFAGFNWSYLNGKEKIILVAEYYEKVAKDVRIVKLRDGRVMTTKKYDELLANWTDFEEPPAVVGKPRTTQMDVIHRYRMIQNQILEHKETDYDFLPLVYCDGNSAIIKTPTNGSIRQITRPYVYNAEGMQRLKNFAGISLANEIENIVQHKFIIKKEAIPKEQEFKDALKDIQKQSNIVVNSVYEEDPNMPINEPIREIARPAAPPEIIAAFTASDSAIQNILGSYDAALGINNNQLSGRAIEMGSIQSNAASMPYIVGIMNGLQRCAQIYVSLMPKVMTTPRTLPVIDKEGRRSYVMINQPQGVQIDYQPNAFNVCVRAGASFQVQKSHTIMMVKEMMGMSPLFAQFIADKGLNFILDNMDGKGVDQLKTMVDQWQQEMAQQKQFAMQKAQQEAQNNPLVLRNKLMENQLQIAKEKSDKEFMVDMLRIKQDEQKLMAEMHETLTSSETQRLKANAEVLSHQIDAQLKHQDQRHRHAKDLADSHHREMEHKAKHEREGLHSDHA